MIVCLYGAVRKLVAYESEPLFDNGNCGSIQYHTLFFSLFFFLMIRPPPTSPLFPYPTLFRSNTAGTPARGGGSPPTPPPSDAPNASRAPNPQPTPPTTTTPADIDHIEVIKGSAARSRSSRR